MPETSQKNQRYLGEFELDEQEPYRELEAPDGAGEPRTVIVFRLHPVGETERRAADRSQFTEPASEAESVLAELEKHETPTFTTSGSAPAEAERRENELVERFRKHLGRSHGALRRWRLKPAGELRPFWTDVYDEQANELYEAKGNATRDNIRRGIGQLLDYRRHIPSAELKLALLLPTRPSDDIVNLLRSLNIACVYESADGLFVRDSASE